MTEILSKRKKRKPAIVITRFTNEEYLMPWWIQHHVQLFDHGIMIDCGSKDNTADIVKEYAPNWEIVRHDDKEFFVRDDIQEGMDYERLYPGCWKMTMNPSEFFCTRNMDALLSSLEADGVMAYAPHGINMADPPGVYDADELTYDKPLVAQRYHGYFEKDRTRSSRFTFTYPGIERYRSRVLHCFEDGNFKDPKLCGNGIHYLGYPFSFPMADALILWFVYSPWTDAIIQRRLNQYYYMPEKSRARCPYPKDYATLERDVEMELYDTVDLRTKKEYQHIFGSWPFNDNLDNKHRHADFNSNQNIFVARGSEESLVGI